MARFLSVEYGIPVDDMARDFPIPVDTGGVRRSVKKADLAAYDLAGTDVEVVTLMVNPGHAVLGA